MAFAYYTRNSAGLSKIRVEIQHKYTVCFSSHPLAAFPIVSRFYNLGFNILATKGTACFLKERGIRTRTLAKISEGSDEILDIIRAGYVSYIVITRSILASGHDDDGVAIRSCAVQNGVTMFTSLDTAKLALDVLEETIPKISTI